MQRLWRIQILGRLCVSGDDQVITRFRTERTRALLAYLAYYPHRSHPREQLIDLLWPEYDLRAGRNCLSIELSHLRHQLEPPGTPRSTVIRADNTSLQLNPFAFTTDVAEFEAAVQSAEAAPSRTAQAQFLAAAVDLYAGALLPGCYLPGCYENWIKPEQQRLNETYIQALRLLVRYEAKSKSVSRALDYARRAVNADPLREETHRDLIWLYAITGQPLVALQQYRELELLLSEQLGAAPSQSTRDLAHKIADSVDCSEPPAIAPLERPIGVSVPTSLPTGTVTLLFIAFDSPTASESPDAPQLPSLLANRRILLRRHLQRFNGYEASGSADVLLAAFSGAADAVACAAETFREAIAGNPSEDARAPTVRMALITGEVRPHEGYYSGPVIDHGYRLLAAANSGQILCSEATTAVLPPPDESRNRLVDLGRYRLFGSSTAERLFQIETPAMSAREPAVPRAQPAEVGSLPLQLTRFFGRDHERLRLRQLITVERRRLLTVTGPGGIGKTRLVLEAAAGLMDTFNQAVWFVPLAKIAGAQDVMDAIHHALRLRHSSSSLVQEEVETALMRQPSLLALDNFEHLVAEGGETVRALLERIPSLFCLVTSRQRLNLSGEYELPIPPLAIPRPADMPERLVSFPSVQLFIDRGQAVRPGFQVTDSNASTVAALCGRLEGIPLAIELAASRVQTMTVAEILTQIEGHPDFLVDRRRDAPERHRSLRTVIDWSYQLLAPELQTFFPQLTVFRGGWTASAAEYVCDEPLAMDFLAQLLECSQVTAEESGTEMRFLLLDTIRGVVRERLDEAERSRIASRHANYYLRLAEEAERRLLGPEAPHWFDRLEREHDNLRAALQWCIETGAAEIGLNLVGVVWRLWYVRGYHREGLDWLNRVLAIDAGAAAPLRIRALNGAGAIAYEAGDYAAARALFDQSLALGRGLDDFSQVATALGNLALVARDVGNYSQACALFEECLDLFRQQNHRRGITLALANLANLATSQQHYVRARDLHRESLEMFRESNDLQNVALGLNNLAYTLLRMGDIASIPDVLEESQTLSLALNNKRLFAHSLTLWGALALNLNDSERAAILLGAEESLRAGLDFAPPPQAISEIERHHAAVRAALGDQAFAIAVSAGRAMTLDQVTAFVRGRRSPSIEPAEPQIDV